MAHSICKTHGPQPAELVTLSVVEMIRKGLTIKPEEIFSVELVYENLEFSGFVTKDDQVRLVSMGAVITKPNIFEFQDEQKMEEALGLFTAICAKCLNDGLRP